MFIPKIIKELEMKIEILEKIVERIVAGDEISSEIFSSQCDINLNVYEKIKSLEELIENHIKEHDEENLPFEPDENQITFNLNEEGEK